MRRPWRCSGNPFGEHAFFDPQCYTATSEDQTRWNGQPALRFNLQSTCKDDPGITELYADPQTLRPTAVDGDVHDADDAGMTVALELRYATVGAYFGRASGLKSITPVISSFKRRKPCEGRPLDRKFS